MASQDGKGHRIRVKQRFAREGDFSSFHPHEVLEFLLFFALPQGDTKPLAKALLERFGTLSAVLEAPMEELIKAPGVGTHTAMMLSMQTALFRYYMQDRWGSRVNLQRPLDAAEYCVAHFIGKRYEELIMICLTTGYDVVHVATLATGTINEISVYPRLVVESAIRHQAQAVILAHNHPGGSRYASAQDIELTNTITESLANIGVRLLDHFVVVGGESLSIREQIALMQHPELADAAETDQKPRRTRRTGREEWGEA